MSHSEIKTLIKHLDSAKSFVKLTKSAVKNSSYELHMAESKLRELLKNACETDDVMLRRLTEARDCKKRFNISSKREKRRALELLNDVCKNIEKYAIQACVPVEFQKNAEAFYHPSSTAVFVYFSRVEGSFNDDDQVLYCFNILSDKIAYTSED